MAPLGERSPDLLAGKGWIQHNPKTVARCWQALLDVCLEEGYGESFSAFKQPGDLVHPLSSVGRVMSEAPAPIASAGSRFGCIDPQGREHQQRYFAHTSGPEKSHIRLETRE